MSGPPRRRRGGLKHAPPLEEVLVHQLQKFERGRTYPREGHGLFSRRVSKLSTLPFGSSRRTGSCGRENRTPKERTRQLVAQDKTTTAPAKAKPSLAIAASILMLSGVAAQAKSASLPFQRLLAAEAALDEICRGAGLNEDAEMYACQARQATMFALDKIGWCYGKVLQVHSEERWHLCDADSNHPSPSDLHAYDH